MSLMERAAKAIEDEIGRQVADNGGHFVPRSNGADWIAFDGNLDLTPLARAVLEAIREPNDDMIRAGEALQAHCSDVDQIFSEMIKIAIHGPE